MCVIARGVRPEAIHRKHWIASPFRLAMTHARTLGMTIY